MSHSRYLVFYRQTMTIEMKEKNFGLTESEYDILIEKLKSGDESMFETIFLKHFNDCLEYLKHNYSADHEEAYDASMDTLLNFRNLLMNDKIVYGNLRYLYTKMASQRLLKSKKKLSKIDLVEEMPEGEEMMDLFSVDEMCILEKAWGKLGKSCQQLLKQFYFEKIQLKEIAALENKSAGAIRKQKERCINVLKNNFKNYLTTEQS